MFSNLIQDCQLAIILLLSPEDLQNLYYSCGKHNTIIQELNKYYGITIKSRDIVSDTLINWFHQHNIKLKYCSKVYEILKQANCSYCL